ncbi:hypothetical protein AAF712_010835 [Marasmius tenuissimus]|uniref:Uncharacterized protein n=1 Tax=Marasmius tenuissimus TaxID=585030 RepID=A0ABR2ZML4_9AGAR
MQSNAIATTPKTLSEHQPQYNALCTALDLDPSSSGNLVDSEGSIEGIGREALRSHRDGQNLAFSMEPSVERDLTEEWYLYSIAHEPIKSREDVRLNLLRYYRGNEVERMMAGREPVKGDWVRLFGEILSDWQVHVPVRMFARDMAKAGFPVVRYRIKWTPEKAREPVEGYVTHGSDSSLWHYRLPALENSDAGVADSWLNRIDEELGEQPLRKMSSRVLALEEDQTISWVLDDL